MKKFEKFFKKATSSILAASMILTLSPPNITIAKESEPQEVIEVTTEVATDTSEEVVTESSEETTDVTTEILTEETTENFVEETTEEVSEETTEVTTDDVIEATTDNIKEVTEETTEEIKTENEYPYNPTEILVKTSNQGIFREGDLIISSYEGLYLLGFRSYEEAVEAVNYYSSVANYAGLNKETFEVADDDYVSEEPVEETAEVTTEATVEDEVSDNNEETNSENINNEEPLVFEDDSLSILNDVVNTGVTGRGKIALIDTGVNGTVSDSVSFVGDGSSTADENGHGTLMYNYIKEEYPDADIISIKVLGANGKGQPVDIYAGLEYAIEHNVSVINLSLSAYATADNAIVEQKINEAINKGIIVVGAVGNKGMDASYFIPARISGAVIVGAIDENGDPLSSSNYGSTLDYLTYANSSSEASARVSGLIARYGIDGLLDTGKVFGFSDDDIIINEDNTDELGILDWDKIVWGIPSEYGPDFEISTLQYVDGEVFPGYVNIEARMGKATGNMLGAWSAPQFDVNYDPADPDEGGKAWQHSITWNRGTSLTYGSQLVSVDFDGTYPYSDLTYSANDFMIFCTQGGNSNTPPQGALIQAMLYFIPSMSTSTKAYYAAGGIYHGGGRTYQHIGMQLYVRKNSTHIGITVHKNATNDFNPSYDNIQYTLYYNDGTPWLLFTMDDAGYTKSIELVSGASSSLNGYTFLGTDVNYVNDEHNDVYALISHSGGILANDFYFKETRTNANFQLDPDNHYVGSYTSGNNVIQMTDDTTPPKGAIQVLKVDQFGNCVGGAKFTLYYADGTTPIITKTTSSESHNLGLCTFDGLDAGTYVVQETAVPNANYTIDNTAYTVTINLNNTVGTADESYSYLFDYNYYKNNAMSSAERTIINDNWGGDNKYSYFKHWYLYGCEEGRRASATFNPTAYTNRYKNSFIAFGIDTASANSKFWGAIHYQQHGANGNYKTLTDAEYSSLPSGAITGNATGLAILKVKNDADLPLVVKKRTSSSCTELVDNNSNYSLEGAKFKIYKDADCTQALTNNAYDFITDANGDTTPFNMFSYLSATQTSIRVFIKEIEASKGYTLNGEAQPVTVIKGTHTTDNPATVTIDEIPEDDPISIVVTKKDDEELPDAPKIFLDGAIFEVKYYAAETEGQINDTTYRRHWYLRTESDGKASFDTRWLVQTFNGSNSDAFYYSEDGEPTFPLGYITIQEVQAPVGYIIDDTVIVRKVEPNLDDVERENRSIIKNHPESQAFSIVKLADDGSTELKPLNHAGFMACRIEDLERDANGNYIFDKTKAITLTESGEKEMFTDTDGNATSRRLRYGTYMVDETTVPEGFQKTNPFFVTITNDSATPQAIRFITDKEKHFYLRIVKYDLVTGRPILKNNSSYKIIDESTGEYISFRTYNGSRYVSQDTFTTDDASILELPQALSFGSYRIEEVKAPEGYNIDSPNGIPVVIDERTAYDSYEDENDTYVVGIINVPVTDTPIYGRYEIEKTGGIRTYDEATGEFVVEDVPLEDIDFGIFAAEDIYTSDGTDTLIYSKGDLAFTITTDADGKASQDNIPLGKYTVKELNTPADFVAVKDTDIEFKLTDKKQDANGKYYVEQKSEFYNAPYFPKVSTTALDSKTEEHTGVVGEEVTIVDKVDCSDLVIGRVYTIRGKLYDTKTKEVYLDNDGEEVKATKTFTATSKDMTVDLEFTYSSTDLAGETIVVFETMYYNDKVVALHTDITDENQQVHYPDVETTALDGKTNTHTGVVDEKVTVVDKVACTNLIIGKEYTIKGKLYNTKTGGAILENGKEVTAEVTFKAEEVNPIIDLTFTLNSKTLAGETIVVFEDLYHKDIKVATHSDLEDENQQVSYPTVGTKAVDKDTDSKSGVTGEVATIVDTVDCKNLVIGQVYVVKGKLYDTKSGEVFLDNGKEVTAEKTFVAIKKDMTVELTFTFNSTSLEGKTTTVFEDLYTENIKVASHSDINDKEQQVDYPQVKTTAKDKATDTHTGVKSETATIIDTVECTNLIVGKEYTVKGKLYNTETGEVFLDNGKEVTAEKTFTADKKDMTVELSFTFNSMSLEGETIVVFEDLYHKNIKVDSHARLDDKEQQVHYPKIGTTAKNPVDGGKVAKPNKNVKLNDTVDVKSVAAGDKFILKGVIYDKATGEKLLINGAEVWSEATLVAPDKDFKTDVIFTFDASSLAGKNIVVFEYLYLVKEDGTEILVASHEDINDEGQSIKFSTEPKTGDRGFADVFIIFILSLMGIVALYLAKRKVLR